MALWLGDVMGEEKPYCPAFAARKVRMVEINGLKVGIPRLDVTTGKVTAMGLSNMQEISRALMKEVKIHNNVPTSKEWDYRLVILKEYVERK
jgi:hypothetical protein